MSLWDLAKADGRDYITPEDVSDAIEKGQSQTDVWLEVLQAVEAKAAEDASLCAFLALDRFSFKVHRREVKPRPWEDQDDEWTEAIDAAHPTRSDSHEEYGVAMKMVGHRHSKGELVSLVNWLLVRLRSK